MHFRLGVETITAKNDGGLHIVKCDPKWSDWIYHGRNALPILSFEVPRGIFECELIVRRNERSIASARMRMLSENMPLRYFVKCWVKFVTKFSMKILKCNTKKYLQPYIWVDIGIRDSWKSRYLIHLLRQTSE